MFTITPDIASLRVFPPRQRLDGDEDDDETTYGCLPSRQRSRAYECFHRASGSRVIMMTMMMMMRRLTDVYNHARRRELTSLSTASEVQSMCDSTVYLAATV